MAADAAMKLKDLYNEERGLGELIFLNKQPARVGGAKTVPNHGKKRVNRIPEVCTSQAAEDLTLTANEAAAA